MKCPTCGFDHPDGIESADRILCNTWAHMYSLDKRLPDKEQFEAMQRKRFLPTHGERDGRTWELHHGHYGWAIDYNWPVIAAKITGGK